MDYKNIERDLDELVNQIPPTINAGWERKQDQDGLRVYEIRLPQVPEQEG